MAFMRLLCGVIITLIMKKTVKIFLFIELITLMVCGLMHIFVVIFSENFPLEVYPMVMGIVLFTFLFTIFIVKPLHKCFFD